MINPFFNRRLATTRKPSAPAQAKAPAPVPARLAASVPARQAPAPIRAMPIADATRDVLKAVEFLEDPFQAKEGDTKLTVKLPLIIGGIAR